MSDALSLLKETYVKLDEVIGPRLLKLPISCKKGCGACCTLFAIITLADAINIVDHITAWPDWKEWVNKIAAAARQMCAPGMTRIEWLSRVIPCVFYDQTAGTCLIYSVRPAECRYFFVVSDPKLCGGPAINKIQIVDIQAERPIWALSLDIHEENGFFGPFACAPIPLMVLHALRYAVSPEWRRQHGQFIEDAMTGLPTPFEWMKTNVSRKEF